MRKNYIYLVVLLVLSTTMFAQKVTLTPTTVNGANVSNGIINLGGVPYSNVTVSVKVEFPDNSAVGDQGTIKIMYSTSTALGANVTIGGDGGQLYFGGGKFATRSFNINLSWGNFLTSGGYIYAEYKINNSTSGAIYKSSFIPVIKDSNPNGGGTVNPPSDAPNPSKIPNSLCCNQTVRLGDKPAPIAGSQYLNPYQDKIYGINSSWAANGNGSVRFANLDNVNKILDIDYITDLGNFTITRKLGYNGDNDLPNKSNTVNITVVPSPILSNEISIVAPVDLNGFFEIISTNPKQISGTRQSGQVNLNILQDPFHISKRGDSFTEIEKFEWEYTKTNAALGGYQNWTTISSKNNYTLGSFNPSDFIATEDNYYLLRRIAIYKDIKKTSNTLKIVLRTIRNNNTICCDQTLVISASNEIDSPAVMTGSTAVSDINEYVRYQWQNQSIDSNSGKIGNWLNIFGATSKDYLPTPLQLVSISDPRKIGEIIWTTPTTYNYRRITESANKKILSYSNEVSLSAITYKQLPLIIVYPNPATSIINIENTSTRTYDGSNLTNYIITIANIMGVPVATNNFTFINPNLLSVNISSLSAGTYFINIQLASGGPIQKITFIKQ